MTITKKTEKRKLTPYQEELVETIKKIKEYKLAVEANIVSTMYLDKDLYYTYSNLKVSDFGNNVWKVYFAIGYDIVIKEKKVLDEITINFYLEKHEKLKEKYIEYGAFETIEKSSEYINKENIDGYVKDLHKWNTVLEMAKMGFPIADRLSEIMDMSIDEIYDEFESKLNHIFINAETEIKSYNACEGLHELIDKLNVGMNVGLPLHNCPILNKEIGGLNIGNIYGLGGLSGAGKSTTAINWLLPSILTHNEKIVFIINEEDETKIQKEMIIWVANNIFKKELHKFILRDGKFTPEHMELLRECATWIEEKKENNNIIVIPLERYTTDIAIKIIKKYASLGDVKYFCIDTLKESANSNSDKTWLDMTRDLVRLYDVIKPSAKNVCLVTTYQLGKIATKQRYYTNNEIGMAKSIVDTMSVNLMIRQPFDDEFSGGKNEITGYKLEGKKNLSKIPFKMDRSKNYIIIFITKNRFGATQKFQIIAEYDLSLNTYKEMGICNITQDW